MRHRGKIVAGACALLAMALVVTPARAVVIIPNADRPLAPDPIGLSQYEGTINTNTASIPHDRAVTAISSEYFLGAKHNGSPFNGLISYQGADYKVVQTITDPNSDLVLFKIHGTTTNPNALLPSFAPLYTGSSETGKDYEVFGFGVPRDGTAAQAAIPGHGWKLSAFSPNTLSYGTGTVAASNIDGGSLGKFLAFTFNTTDAHASMLTGSDSGGGLFVNDNGVYKLAGVNFASDFRYYTDAQGHGQFDAALYDRTGFFEQSTDSHGNTIYVPVTGPAVSYDTQISANLGFIGKYVVVPEPSSIVLVGLGLGGLGAWRRGRSRRSAR